MILWIINFKLFSSSLFWIYGGSIHEAMKINQNKNLQFIIFIPCHNSRDSHIISIHLPTHSKNSLLKMYLCQGCSSVFWNQFTNHVYRLSSFPSISSLCRHLHCTVSITMVTSKPRQRIPSVTATGHHHWEERQWRPRMTENRIRKNKTKMMEASNQTILCILSTGIPGTPHYLLLALPKILQIMHYLYLQMKNLNN